MFPVFMWNWEILKYSRFLSQFWTLLQTLRKRTQGAAANAVSALDAACDFTHFWSFPKLWLIKKEDYLKYWSYYSEFWIQSLLIIFWTVTHMKTGITWNVGLLTESYFNILASLGRGAFDKIFQTSSTIWHLNNVVFSPCKILFLCKNLGF